MDPLYIKTVNLAELNIYCTETCNYTYPHSQAFKFIMKTKSNCIIFIESAINTITEKNRL